MLPTRDFRQLAKARRAPLLGVQPLMNQQWSQDEASEMSNVVPQEVVSSCRSHRPGEHFVNAAEQQARSAAGQAEKRAGDRQARNASPPAPPHDRAHG